VESGLETMEQDLEALVRRSWEVGDGQDPEQVPRKERARASRRRWLRKRGVVEADDDDEEIEETDFPVRSSPAPPKAGKDKPPEKEKESKKGKKEDAAMTPAQPVETPEEIAAREEQMLAAAVQRASAKHTNSAIADFIFRHTEMDAVLTCEDPFTVMPLESNDDVKLEAETCEELAIPFTAVALAETRQAGVAAAASELQQMHEIAEAAKARNTQALTDLAKWRDEQALRVPPFLGQREELRETLSHRAGLQATLKEVLNDPLQMEAAPLQLAIDEADKAKVGLWDCDLLESAHLKVQLFEATVRLRSLIGSLAERPLSDPSVREELVNLLGESTKLQDELSLKHVKLPPELGQDGLLAQAAALLPEGT